MDLTDIIAILDAGSRIAARGAFVRGDRQLELSFRWSLGPVIYRIGTVSVNHETLMKSAGHYAEAEYPGFSTDPLDAFRHLASDLQRFGGDFMCSDGATIIAASKAKAGIP
jgi:hypothetical protein